MTTSLLYMQCRQTRYFVLFTSLPRLRISYTGNPLPSLVFSSKTMTLPSHMYMQNPLIPFSSIITYPEAVRIYDANALAGFFANVSGSVNVPTLLCIWKLLDELAGCDTWLLLTAHANMVSPEVLTCPPDHLLQPVQATSTDQWVSLREERRVFNVAEE